MFPLSKKECEAVQAYAKGAKSVTGYDPLLLYAKYHTVCSIRFV